MGALDTRGGGWLGGAAGWRWLAVVQVLFWTSVFIHRSLFNWAWSASAGSVWERFVSVFIGFALTTALWIALRRRDGSGAIGRLVIGFLAVQVILVVHTAIDRAIFLAGSPAGAIALMGGLPFRRMLTFNWWIFVSWYGLMVGMELAANLARTQMSIRQADEVARAARLRMLRYELNPHFLFNALNAISSLVLDGRGAEAERAIAILSRFLRRAVYDRPAQLIALADELALEALYMEFESLRFGDAVRFEVDVAPGLDHARTPSLILQPLIENAVKHGVARGGRDGVVRVRAYAAGSRLVLSVEDNGPGHAEPDALLARANGVGLRNTRERLEAMYGAQAAFTLARSPLGGVEARVALPLQLGALAPSAPAGLVASGDAALSFPNYKNAAAAQ